ncbi:Rho guanine nucleotide exchange factor 11 [Bagarius yarrelli]|uniref:Rho guanine nucleotide exchange factor 11 n=1 Tax=Bagarius yarrelli TaxID=175774 RepID=A0A556U624_BAGYA|nr:Rho guanine nucleotide exchange factor 11 [Bagarius yarrelli]
MSVRPPTSTLDRLSSLTLGDSKPSLGQQKDSFPEFTSDAAAAGLVQRCVVVQRDSLGFGFTVCGERIKLVQNVRPGGAAVKAGVQEGDRIIKVNGSLVSSMSHQEVVKMIKAGTYVALTLQGPPPSVASVPLQPLTPDLPANHRTQLGDETTPPPPPPPLPASAIGTPSQRITGPKPLQDPEFQKHATQILKKMLEQGEAELQDLLEEQSRNPSASLVERIESAKRRANEVREKMQKELAVKAHIIGPDEEEDDDDSYMINEMDGPFQDIELLKTRPAHMTVFMRYIFSQLLDPNPLLFYLSVEAYLGSTPKDARTIAPQICSQFLDPDAPLKIKVRDEYLSDIESRLHAQEDIRGPLSELQQQVLPEIQDQIQDYRNKQLMGLGSLFGESDLQQLDGEPTKERQVVEKQTTALWELLSKHEEDRSSPLASAITLYLRHAGIKLRDSKLFPGLSTEKDKWLAFFPKTKRHFENHTDCEEGENGGQRLSTGSPRGRELDSESLKAQGEGRRRGGATGAESVPRSRSDVDMEDCDEREGPGLRPLHHSASSSASSSSARSLENPTPPYTPRARRRSVDTPLALLPDAPPLEEDIVDCQNWQETVESHTLSSLSSREIDRQAVIYELFTTETSHLRTLKVLDQVFFRKMRNLLTADELSCIFPNLPQVYELHASLCESMRKLRESSIVQGIGDIMLARFEDAAGEEFQEQVSHLCSQQSQALELIKNKQRKDPRFAHLIQSSLAPPLQLKDLLVSEMQRLTKYPLLLDNIIKHTEAGSPDLQPLLRAQVCCRRILQAVNEVVRETEHRQLLSSQYQRRLDLSPPLERQANPVAASFNWYHPLSHFSNLSLLSSDYRLRYTFFFQNLDLTTKRMIHEGPLTWKVSKDKAIEVQALLLSDLLVLLQRGPDDRLILRCPSRSGWAAAETTDNKTPFCPVVRLISSLVRSNATDNKALYVVSTSETQMYELVAGTSLERNTWKDLLEKTIALASEGAAAVKHGSPAQSFTRRLRDAHVIQDGSLAEETSSVERDLQSDDESALPSSTPTEQSEDPLRNDAHSNLEPRPEVSEAALQDVETLRQLIFRDLEDGWSQDSDDTPTNEPSNEPILVTDRPGSEASEASFTESPNQSIPDHVDAPPTEAEQPTFQVIRKGNMFYLVMPRDQMGALTEESSTDDVEDQSPSEAPEAMSMSSQQDDEERGTRSRSHPDVSRNESRISQAIKNTHEIFQTMDELMKKLHRLKEIEVEHYRLVNTEKKKSHTGPNSDDIIHTSPSIVRMPSMDRGAGDGVRLKTNNLMFKKLMFNSV